MNRAKECREKAGFSLKDDIFQFYPVRDIQNYENNLGQPLRLEYLTSLADLYNVSLDYLIGRDRNYINIPDLAVSNEQLNTINQILKLSNKELNLVNQFISALKSDPRNNIF